MRVLWVTNMWPDEQRPWYGAFIHSQAESLRSQGIALDVVYVPGYRGKHHYALGAHRMRRAAGGSSYDIVHAHYGHSAMLARLQLSTPLVISYCGSDLLGTPRGGGRRGRSRGSVTLAYCFAQLARTAAATITKSEQMAEQLPPACRTRNYVIPNGVDLSSSFVPIDRALARTRLGWSGEQPNVLFVGNPDNPTKNFALAREVCTELAQRGRPANLHVAWRVEPSAIPLWMNAADVLLFPSLSEGSPNVIKEAMAVELPIVSARVGDVPQRLNGAPGTFVVDYDKKAMADAVVSALAAGRAPAAREAIRELSTEQVAERIRSVYEFVLSNGAIHHRTH